MRSFTTFTVMALVLGAAAMAEARPGGAAAPRAGWRSTPRPKPLTVGNKIVGQVRRITPLRRATVIELSKPILVKSSQRNGRTHKISEVRLPIGAKGRGAPLTFVGNGRDVTLRITGISTTGRPKRVPANSPLRNPLVFVSQELR